MTDVQNYKISDRYTKPEGHAFLTGVQALARIPIQQLWADRKAGLNTAAFISGYQGSPLAGFDQEVARAAKMAPELPIICEPAVNEELGATAVMGSQLASEQPDCKYDGILGLWYGKAPGLDRASDALRHAVFAGTSHYGGAVALVGDDPAAKSSTLPSSSDSALVDLHMPILYPGDVQEVLDLGRHAIALSRATGVWSSMKMVAAVADGSGTAYLGSDRSKPSVETITVDGEPYVHHPSGHLLTPRTLDIEREFGEVRSGLVLRYAVENKLNHATADPTDAWVGIVASGYTYHELIEALRRLGLESIDQIEAAGIRLVQMTMPVPFDKENVRRLARGLEEIIIVEEKNPTLEWLIKDALYGGPDQPLVLGKKYPDGRTLMRNHGLLDADSMVEGLRERLSPRLAGRLAPRPEPERTKTLIPLTNTRSPYFCSGCPHNQSTKVPEASLIGAGIGCHTMVMLQDPEKSGEIAGLTAMGGEGTQWIGMSPFLERDHFIQNLGDGTFFHSGQLAIQGAIAAKVNITYKLLYNATVAMTGGQDPVGVVGVPEIATILLAHGAADVRITTDDVSAYKGVDLPEGPRGRVKVWDRNRIVEAQEELAAIKGVTILIHDQACAAQNRRLRKRNKIATPKQRVVINHRICEACGDCGEVSNCLSVQAFDTPFGIKTTIDQDSCNLDFSCIGGDCPSFMTVEVSDNPRSTAPPKTSISGDLAAMRAAAQSGGLPEPRPTTSSDELNLRMAGIGGTGVVTVAQILSTAAMLDGWKVRGLDQTGLSQKAGPVVSDIRLSRGDVPPSNMIGRGEADAILAFDLLVGADDRTLSVASDGATSFVGSTTQTPTGAMVGHPEIDYPSLKMLTGRIEAATGSQHNRFVDAGAITKGLFGGNTSANLFMLGVAIQNGAIPVSPHALESAIDLNGVAVKTNVEAFDWGRRWVENSAAVQAAAGLPDMTTNPDQENHDGPQSTGSGLDSGSGLEAPIDPGLAKRVHTVVSELHPNENQDFLQLVQMLAADLVDYQNDDYAKGFLDVVSQAIKADIRASAEGEAGALSEAVARGLHKLLAYKDEYEVARLLLLTGTTDAAEAVAGPDAKVTWKLDPPILNSLGRFGGLTKGSGKISVPAKLGAPVMKSLVKMKRLRGTRLDPFGRAEVRQVERALVSEYREALTEILPKVTGGNIDEAIKIATLAMDVRGFEGIKLERAATMRSGLAKRRADFGR